MKELKIRLSTIESVKEFVATANKYPFDLDLVSGRYAVDAKSIMGIFSLDLNKVLKLSIHDGGSKAEEFIAEIKQFVVE